MEFFTREWLSGGLDEAAFEARTPAYEAHLDRTLWTLPGTVRTLARGVNLHDGLIRSVHIGKKRSILLLGLRCGDLQAGYFDVDLTYKGVDWASSNIRDLRAIASSSQTEALYDEIDVNDTKGHRLCIHRIIFGPKGEIEVVFETLGLKLVPRRGREFVRARTVYTQSTK